MNRCDNNRVREMLAAYELGLLSEDERAEVETHLLECDFCFQDVREFETASSLLSTDGDVRETIHDELVSTDLPGGPETDQEHARSRKVWKAIVPTSLVAAAVLVFLLLRPFEFEIHSTQEAVAAENRLLVMPFVDRSMDSAGARLGESISSLIITDLSESRYVQVVSSQRLFDALAALGYLGAAIRDEEVTASVASEARARWVLTGRILESTPRLQLTIELSDTESGDLVYSERFRGAPDEDMFALVDRMTVEIKQALALPAAAYREPDRPVSAATTTSVDAYRHYVEGIEYIQRIYYDEAATSFRRALEYDSTYALAYFWLARLGQGGMLDKAIEYMDHASARERFYIRSMAAAFEGDTARAVAVLKDLLELYPDDRTAYRDLARLEVGGSRFEQAIGYYRAALEIDPRYRQAYNRMAYLYAEMGKPDSALWAVNQYIALAPEEPNPYDTQGDILARGGDLHGAIASYEKVREIRPDFSWCHALFMLGHLYVYDREFELARERFQEALEIGGRDSRSVARSNLALLPMYRGKFREALVAMDQAIAVDRMENIGLNRRFQLQLKIRLKADLYAEYTGSPSGPSGRSGSRQ
jgi:tetratricopeptide (TPR) repeat protein